MLRFLVLTLFLLIGLSARAAAADRIPSELVGVWATEGSELKSDLLLKGQAIYLTAEGTGAILVGPPPIGVRFQGSYDAARRTVLARIVDQGQVHSRTLTFDAAAGIIAMGNERYIRRFDKISASTLSRLLRSEH